MSNTTTATGADFTQLSAHARNLALAHDIEIVGCARGFNAFADGEIISADCTAAEIEKWLEGYGRAKNDESYQRMEGNSTRFTDVEFNEVLNHVRYRAWSLVADHTGVKVFGPNFTTHAASGAEFFAFINGFNAAGAALGMLGTGAQDPEQDGGE